MKSFLNLVSISILLFTILFYPFRSQANPFSTSSKNEAAVSAATPRTLPEPAVDGQILYVKKGATGDGSSWENALGELADALKWAHENRGDWTDQTPLKIFVSRGVYYPKYTPDDGKEFADDGIHNSFLMVKDVQLYGGFDPDNGITSLSQLRIFDADNGTVLNGDLNGDDVVTGVGTGLQLLNRNDNAVHVAIAAGELGTAVLDGFTLSGGWARDLTSGNFSKIYVDGLLVEDMNGGGLICTTNSAFVLNNLIFRFNTGYHGGGLYTGGISLITNSSFIRNSGSLGGGIWGAADGFVGRNLLFDGNRASFGGGVGFNNNNVSINVTIENATFVRNEAFTTGGTIVVYRNANVSVRNSIGIANGNAHGIQFSGSFEFHHSLFQGETSTTNGNLNAGLYGPQDIFRNFDLQDYTLKTGSPAIDAGNPLWYTGNASTDLNLIGFQRLIGPSIDLGPIEFSTPPVLTSIDHDQFHYTTGSNPVKIDVGGNAGISDQNDGNFGGGSIILQLKEGSPTEDILGLSEGMTPAGELTISGNQVLLDNLTVGWLQGGSNGVPLLIRFTESTLATSVAAILPQLTFANNAVTPDPALRTLSLQVQNGYGAYSEPATIFGSVTAQTSALQIVASQDATLYLNAIGSSVVIDPTLSISGPAGLQITGATIEIVPFRDGDTLTVATLDGLLDSHHFSNGVLTLTGNGSAGQWQTLLQQARLSGRIPSLDPISQTIHFSISTATQTLSAEKTVQSYYLPTIQPTAENTIYVDKSIQGGTQTGNSWAEAVTELSDALKWADENRTEWSAVAPLKIYVAKGTYHPLYQASDANFGTDGGRLNSFKLVNNVEIFGGFNPSAGITDLSHERALEGPNASILSGDLNNDDQINIPNGVESLTLENTAENVYAVVVGAATLDGAVLDGFVITGGRGDNQGIGYTVEGRFIYANQGGAVQITYGSPVLRNLTMYGNFSSQYGAALHLGTSEAIVENLTAYHNAASLGTVSTLFGYTAPTLTNVNIHHNHAGIYGTSGIYAGSSSPLINQAKIQHNIGTSFNAAGGTHIEISNSIISGNISSYPWRPTIEFSFLGTGATTSMTILNSLIAKNSGDYALGDPLETNLKIYNSIVTAPTGGIGAPNASTYEIRNSLVTRIAENEDKGILDPNIELDNLFNDIDNDDFTLKQNGNTSGRILAENPLIDAGNNTFYQTAIYGTSDLAGDIRIRNNTIDIGPYEVQFGNDPLPIRLASFKGYPENNVITLEWTVAEEVNASHFVIERSSDGVDFKQIGERAARLVPRYSYQDDSPYDAPVSYYRLKMVDMDETYTYSGVISVRRAVLDEVSVYPNPIARGQAIKVESVVATDATLFDQSGRQIQKFGLRSGVTTLDLPTTTTGLYVLRTSEGRIIRLIVQ